MPQTAVANLLKMDLWDLAEVRAGKGANAATIRYRKPVLSGQEATGYDRVLRIVWVFAPEGSRVLPSEELGERMGLFEDRLCEAVEHDAHAVLAAVLTFDGARQWVFYTGDVPECGRRIEAMPQEAEPYPVEQTAESDPEWSYLRDEILKRVPWRGEGNGPAVSGV